MSLPFSYFSYFFFFLVSTFGFTVEMDRTGPWWLLPVDPDPVA